MEEVKQQRKPRVYEIKERNEENVKLANGKL